jgi:hypothetical protein
MTKAKIYLVGESEDDLVPMEESSYVQEAHLQTLLARYPDLLPGDQITPDDPRRWLLVAREMAVPGDELEETGREILVAFQALGIPTKDVQWQRALELALAHDRSAYDGAYLALAEETGGELVTGDRRLHNAVKDHLPWVLWIESAN